MKKIAFNLSKDFHLHPISINKVYELESNSTELLFNTIVEPDMAYELHVETDKEKFYKVLDKKDNYVSLIMSNAVLARSGEMKIQVKGVSINPTTDEQTVLISNAFLITVGSFINAKFEPTPEEMDEFEKLVVRVEEIDNRVTQLISDVGEVASDLEAERAERLAAEAETERQLEEANSKIKEEEEQRKQSDNEQNIALNSLAQSISEIIVELAQKAPASVLETINVILASIETLENIKADKSSVYDKEQTNALLDQKAGTGDLSALNTLLRQEIAKKQDILIAGANIIIEGNTISSTGGGAGDVTKEYLKQNYYDKLFFEDTVTLETTGDNTTVTSADIVYEGLVNASKALSDSEKLKIETWLGLSETYLTMYNATPYQVNGQYVPAHKKYVDDAINGLNSIIGSGVIE